MDSTPSFIAQVLTMLGNLRGDMQSMTERVNNLEVTRLQVFRPHRHKVSPRTP